MADAMELREETAPVFRGGSVPARGYTYRDYLSWGEDVRCELIDGVPHMMAAPSVWHQLTAGEIYRQLGNWLEGKPCRPFTAPFDVRLFPPRDGADAESDATVVQPDVLVVCDMEKLSDGRACKGAPDFIVEVASKGSRGKDFGEKKSLYEKAGVREYWVVNDDAVYKYAMADGKYQETICELGEGLEMDVGVLPGCRVSFRGIASQAFEKRGA